MSPPQGHTVLLHGNASYLREIQQVLAQAGIRTATGPLPGSG